jgi:hypothetical protein
VWISHNVSFLTQDSWNITKETNKGKRQTWKFTTANKKLKWLISTFNTFAVQKLRKTFKFSIPAVVFSLQNTIKKNAFASQSTAGTIKRRKIKSTCCSKNKVFTMLWYIDTVYTVKHLRLVIIKFSTKKVNKFRSSFHSFNTTCFHKTKSLWWNIKKTHTRHKWMKLGIHYMALVIYECFIEIMIKSRKQYVRHFVWMVLI